jgi:restriction system protein
MIACRDGKRTMTTRGSRRGARSAHRRLVAALNVAGLGLVLLLLPRLMGHSVMAAGLRPLAAAGWLLVIAGLVMAVVLRAKSKRPALTSQAPEPGPPVLPRAPRRPQRPLPQVARIAPVAQDSAQAIVADVAAAEPAARSLSPETRPRQWGPGVFAAIEWRRFEAVVEELFAQAGFLTKALSHGPDDGVDVWLYSKSRPEGEPVSVVQCKHWQGKKVGVDKVRELRGVMAARHVTRGQFATTSTFTPEAIAFGEANGIKLHDMASLLALIATRTPQQQQALLDVALEGEYWRPTCASCGVKMVERAPKAGSNTFWGCVNFPKCRTTMVKRAGRALDPR